jgi:hypothetical protein
VWVMMVQFQKGRAASRMSAEEELVVVVVVVTIVLVVLVVPAVQITHASGHPNTVEQAGTLAAA